MKTIYDRQWTLALPPFRNLIFLCRPLPHLSCVWLFCGNAAGQYIIANIEAGRLAGNSDHSHSTGLSQPKKSRAARKIGPRFSRNQLAATGPIWFPALRLEDRKSVV